LNLKYSILTNGNPYPMEPLYNVPWFKVLPHLAFNFSDPKTIMSVLKFFHLIRLLSYPRTVIICQCIVHNTISNQGQIVTCHDRTKSSSIRMHFGNAVPFM
jgi:hypothetical protein